MREAGALPVLSSIAPVVAGARHVRFCPEALADAVTRFGAGLAETPGWEHPCHHFGGGPETARWVFALDTLNHCFWPEAGEPAWAIEWRGEWWSGYFGLAGALSRAAGDGAPLADARYLAGISEADLAHVFRGRGVIPMFRERLENLREVGRVLVARFSGDAVHLVREARGSAPALAVLCAREFPSFRDTALWGGREVWFLKRAQIFAADLNAAFSGKTFGSFRDMASLTAFADYKLPQVLREMGVLCYARGLAEKVDAREQLAPGCEEEVEIRAMTVHAVEALKGAFAARGRAATSPEIDAWLWGLGQREEFRARPYHRTRTIFY